MPPSSRQPWPLPLQALRARGCPRPTRSVSVARQSAAAPCRTAPKLRVRHAVVRVDANVASAAAREGVPGQMKFLHSGGRNAVQVAVGIKTMVHGIDVEIVDVEQYGAAGLPNQRRQELPLR